MFIVVSESYDTLLLPGIILYIYVYKTDVNVFQVIIVS